MADTPKQKTKLSTKKSLTVRERTQKSSKERPRRVRRVASKATSPLRKLRRTDKKKHRALPNNKFGRTLGRIKSWLTPRFLIGAWKELKLVTWPNRKETIRLTIAVFVFAFVFAVFVGILDYGLDKLFRKLILKS